MKLNKQQVIALLAKYDSNLVAKKLARKVMTLSAKEIGESILSTKMPKQRLINIEIVRH
jgi:hypothetical protein